MGGTKLANRTRQAAANMLRLDTPAAADTEHLSTGSGENLWLALLAQGQLNRLLPGKRRTLPVGLAELSLPHLLTKAALLVDAQPLLHR
jgi:hypothetical protein